MADENKGSIFLKLVLDTLVFRQYHETYIVNEEGADTETPFDDALHAALVKEFRSLFVDLSMGLEDLGYEVIEEFYTDHVLDENGYELAISGDYDEDSSVVEDLRGVFEKKAGEFLADLPSLLSDMELANAE